MKKVVFLEILLLVLVIAAAAFFFWQTNMLQPNVSLDVPAATQPAEPEPEAEPVPAPEVEEEPEVEAAPVEETEPAETLHVQDSWVEVLDGHDLTADEYFIYDLTADKYLLRSNAVDTKIYPASITKLFTAYVALLHADGNDEITVGDEIKLIDTDSSVADLKVGDVLTVDQLVAAMLLPSGNDAAYALTTAVGRQLAEDPDMSAKAAMQRFVEQMNTDAEELGLTNSHFTTPDGIHDEKHYIGMDDMVSIAKLALANEVIARYVASAEESVSAGESRSLSWENTNLLLDKESEYYSDQAVGLKTGYTTPAGYCVLSAVQIGQRDLLIGVFGSDEKEVRFADTLYLLARNFALDIYEPVSYAPSNDVSNEAA